MKKVQLDISDLEVESFEVTGSDAPRGTVLGRATRADTWCDECVSLAYTGCGDCNSGYTNSACGGCGGGGLTGNCVSYEGCTQNPNDLQCYSNFNETVCGLSCWHPTQCGC